MTEIAEKVQAALDSMGCQGTPVPEMPESDCETDGGGADECAKDRMIRIPTLVEQLENQAMDLEKALTETRELIALLKANPDAERIFTLAGRRRGWV